MKLLPSLKESTTTIEASYQKGKGFPSFMGNIWKFYAPNCLAASRNTALSNKNCERLNDRLKQALLNQHQRNVSPKYREAVNVLEEEMVSSRVNRANTLVEEVQTQLSGEVPPQSLKKLPSLPSKSLNKVSSTWLNYIRQNINWERLIPPTFTSTIHSLPTFKGHLLKRKAQLNFHPSTASFSSKYNISLMGGISTFAISSQDPIVTVEINQATNFHLQGNYEEAKEHFKMLYDNIALSDKELGKVLWGLANAEYHLEELSIAQLHCQHLINMIGDDTTSSSYKNQLLVDAHLLLAQIDLKRDRVLNADLKAKKVISQLEPSDSQKNRAYLLLSVISLEKEDIAKSKENLKKIKIDIMNTDKEYQVDFYKQYALLSFKERAYDQSKAYFESAYNCAHTDLLKFEVLYTRIDAFEEQDANDAWDAFVQTQQLKLNEKQQAQIESFGQVLAVQLGKPFSPSYLSSEPLVVEQLAGILPQLPASRGLDLITLPESPLQIARSSNCRDNLDTTPFMTPHRDYAALSWHVYKDKIVPLEQGDWDILFEATDDNPQKTEIDGYFGRIYINRHNKELAVVHRGTINLENWINNAHYMNDNFHPMYAQAKKLTNKAQFQIDNNGEFTNYRIIQVGHSLGGCIAEVLSWLHQQEAVTFESPGSLELIKEAIKANPNTQLPDYTQTRIIGYFAEPNLLNTPKFHIGKRIRVFPNLKRNPSFINRLIMGSNNSVTKTLERHSMEAMADLFKKNPTPKMEKIVLWPHGPSGFFAYEKFMEGIESRNGDRTLPFQGLDAKDKMFLGYDVDRHPLSKKINLTKEFSSQERTWLIDALNKPPEDRERQYLLSSQVCDCLKVVDDDTIELEGSLTREPFILYVKRCYTNSVQE